MVKIQVRRNVDATLAYFTRDPALQPDERRGRWLGHGADLAGLRVGQPVCPRDLAWALQGYGPAGQPLFFRRQPHRRCAWDCVVTVDKSVSVAALCSWESPRIQAVFRLAVMRLVPHMESLAHHQDHARTGRALPTDNLIVALYVHHASRHLDPHDHAHLLVINATQGTSGKSHDHRWRALEPAPLYGQQAALRWVFNAELHRQLHRHGFRADTDAVTGITRLPVSRALCDRYSQAHATIVKKAADLLVHQTFPAEWERLTPAELRNRLNDRLRPAKRLPPAEWQSLLTHAEKAHLSERLVKDLTRSWETRTLKAARPPEPAEEGFPVWTPPLPRFGDTAGHQEEAREILGEELGRTSLFYSPQAIQAATCRAAARNLDVPLGAFARAADWWSRHRPASPKPFSRAQAAKFEAVIQVQARIGAEQRLPSLKRGQEEHPVAP